MNYVQQIDNELKRSYGIITSEFLRNNNIPFIYLTQKVRKGELEKVSRGIYVAPDGDYDELYFYQLRYKKAIFSHLTSLRLLNATESLPYKIYVTVYDGYKFNHKDDSVEVKYVPKNVYNLGVVEVETPFGNKVKAYSYERTLCDFLKNKKGIDPETYEKTIKGYKYYDQKNIGLLLKLAKQLKVFNKLEDVVEITYDD